MFYLNSFAEVVKSSAITSNKTSLKKMARVTLAKNAYTGPLEPVNNRWLAKISRVSGKTLLLLCLLSLNYSRVKIFPQCLCTILTRCTASIYAHQEMSL